MKKVLSVFKRDIRAIIKNPVAIIIVVGICFIPSLYAWVNIKAAWDPYENTSTIPIAVVNNDKGSEFNGEQLNMGDEVIKKLEDNKQIGWKFVDEKQANLGVVDGSYYAVIEIPEDFSKDLTSLVTDNPKKPDIIYKVDTKSNPVSGKITEVAEQSLVQEIKTNFVATVNSTIFSSLNDVGKNVEKNKESILKMKNETILLNEHMDSVLNILGDVSANSENLNTYLMGIKDTLPGLTTNIENMQKNNKDAGDLAKYTKNSFDNSFSNIETNLNNLKDSSDRVGIIIKNLSGNAGTGINNNVNSSLNMIRQNIETMKKNISAMNTYLNSINDKVHNQSIDSIIKSLNDINSMLDNELKKVDALEKAASNANANISADLGSLAGVSSNVSGKITTTLNDYNKKVKPELNKIFENFVSLTNDANKILEGSKNTVNQINTIVNSAIDGTKLTTETASHLKATLESFKTEIGDLSKKLKEVSDDDLAQILSIIQSNPEVMGGNLATPFEVKDESIYKIPNYGTGMTPIYSVLAIWVGGLILTSVLKTEVAPFKGSEKLSVRQKYLGKMITFVVLGSIQGAIIALGDKFLLGVYTVNTPLMIAFAIVSAISFTIIIYTLVSLFGNLGKAFSIIFMVLQLAGSGGTYPIQVDPLFFRIIQPFFPFTYALGGFREAIAGPLISSVVMDFAMLMILSGAFLLVGVLFKEKLDKKVRRFEEKFEESGIAE